MKIHPTKLPDCFIIEPRVFQDQRGFFFESFNKKVLEHLLGRTLEFVQDNQSLSGRGVLRGMHFQEGEHAQAKLVRVVRGELLDVVLDLRTASPTFGEHIKIHLSAENRKMLFIPRGMAHGFLSLEDNTLFLYKSDNYYHKDSERGLRYNDPDLSIDWEFPERELLLSDKDKEWPPFKQWAQ